MAEGRKPSGLCGTGKFAPFRSLDHVIPCDDLVPNQNYQLNECLPLPTRRALEILNTIRWPFATMQLQDDFCTQRPGRVV